MCCSGTWTQGAVPWPAGSAGNPLPRHVPPGDEAAGHLHARVGGPVQVIEHLLTEVPGHQGAERTSGGIADEFQIANLLCDDLQTWAGAECLYLWAEDLAKGHILEVEGGP
jgi:hypothetical protein